MAESEPVPHPHSSPRWLTELVFLGAILSLAMALFHGLAGRYALDCDDTNLALAISRFDIIHFQPHPLGYLGYVLVLKLVHVVTGLDPVSVTRLVSRGFALLAILFTWRPRITTASGFFLCRESWQTFCAIGSPCTATIGSWSIHAPRTVCVTSCACIRAVKSAATTRKVMFAFVLTAFRIPGCALATSASALHRQVRAPGCDAVRDWPGMALASDL